MFWRDLHMGVHFRGHLFSFLLVVLGSSLALPLQAQQPGGAEVNPVPEPSRGGFVHAVYFWLRPDLSPAQREAFVQGLQTLRSIETVQHGWIGVPAPTDRSIIERSYSYALTLVFANTAGQDAYQVHPVHDRFREDFGDFWTQVLIYDSVETTGPR
jgi:hypothetical protein